MARAPGRLRLVCRDYTRLAGSRDRAGAVVGVRRGIGEGQQQRRRRVPGRHAGAL